MSNLLKRYLDQNKLVDTGSDQDIGIYHGGTRCYLMEAWFWRYRGKKCPGRAVKAIYRAAARYQRKEV